MGGQQSLPLAVVADLRIGRITPRPHTASQAARVLASYRVPVKRDWRAHCAELLASLAPTASGDHA